MLIAAILTISYLYAGRNAARTEADHYKQLLVEERQQTKMINDVRCDANRKLIEKLEEKSKEAFKYSQMAADLRARIMKKLASLQEEIK